GARLRYGSRCLILTPASASSWRRKTCPRWRWMSFRKRQSGGGSNKLDPGEVWVANHLALLEKGIPIIQFVTNLSQIGKNRFVMIAAPLKIKGGDASPARVLALVE